MTMRARVIAWSVPLLLVAPAPVLGQAAPVAVIDPVAKGATERNQAGIRLLGAGSPPDRAMAGVFEPIVSLSAEDGETSVSLAFSFDLQSYAPKRVPVTKTDGATYYRVSRSKLSIVATAPIEGEREALTALFAGDSMIDGAKIKIAFSKVSNTLGDGRHAELLHPEAFQNCITVETTNWNRLHPDDTANPQQTLAAFQSEVDATADLQIILEEHGDANAKPLYVFLAQRCVPGREGSPLRNPEALVDTYTSRGDEYRARFYNRDSWATFWGGDASVGQDGYTYLDRTVFDTPEVNRTSWEVGAYAGAVNWNSTFSARLRGVYGRTWKLPDEGEACEPAGDPPEDQCLSGPDGPPEKIETGLVSFETRHLFALSKTRTIAFAPQVTYRFEDDAIGVEVPVYLAPDDDGKLTGGLKFAWTSKDDEVGVGVFVGVPFGGVIPR